MTRNQCLGVRSISILRVLEEHSLGGLRAGVIARLAGYQGVKIGWWLVSLRKSGYITVAEHRYRITRAGREILADYRAALGIAVSRSAAA